MVVEAQATNTTPAHEVRSRAAAALMGNLDVAEQRHAAAVAAAERRGIERAAEVARMAARDLNPNIATFSAGYANGCLDNVAAILALPPSDGDALAEAIQREREACAKFVEDGANGWAGKDFRYQIADAIRARGEAGR